MVLWEGSRMDRLTVVSDATAMVSKTSPTCCEFTARARLGSQRVAGVQTGAMSLASVLRDLGHKRWFARVGRVLVRADRRVGLLTKGRLVAFGSRELPSMLITTTGARSGLRRTSPLLYVTDGDAYIVAGSNWGQSQHPAWSANLIANPDATV